MAKSPMTLVQKEAKRQKILKEYIWMRHESHKADPKRAPPRKDDGKKGQDKEPHQDAQALIKGNLAKGVHTYVFIKGKNTSRAEGKEYYAWNAWNYLGSLPKGDVRDIYRRSQCAWYHFYLPDHKPNFYQAFPIKALGGYRELGNYEELKEFIAYYRSKPVLTREEQAQLEYAKICRGKVGMALNPKVNVSTVGCSFPYTWQAHHILPMNCFYAYLKEWHILIILGSNYDINSGSNIIFLPEKPDGIWHHRLPFHQSSHPDYDIKLKSDFKELKDLLDQKKGKECSEQISAASEKLLLDMETKAFKYLANEYGMRKLT